MIHSYELNLAAKDSPIKIIRHHHPVTQREIEIDSTLKVKVIVSYNTYCE